jgi:hypothetical protein
VRGDENGLRRHGDGVGVRREGSTDISRFAGLLVDVQCGCCCAACGVPTLILKK